MIAVEKPGWFLLGAWTLERPSFCFSLAVPENPILLAGLCSIWMVAGEVFQQVLEEAGCMAFHLAEALSAQVPGVEEGLAGSKEGWGEGRWAAEKAP